MSDYERRITVSVAPDPAFAALSKAQNLPRYVEGMVFARPGTEDRVHVVGEVQGRHEDGDANVGVDETERRMEWGGVGGSRYRGSLEATPTTMALR
jgi:hypothetical protein